jgi:hypothetical protein
MPDVTAPKSLLTSWLAALFAIPATLIAAVAGQGLGTLAASGGWIGACLAWDRGVWALVNQPVLNFSASWAATGYWLGTWFVPLALAVVLMPLSRRLTTLGGQLLAIQTAWVALVIGASWQVFLDPVDGHLARWLFFHDLPLELRWTAPIVAVAASAPISLRLLAIARITRFNLSRARRVGLVLLHLFPLPLAWMATTVLLGGRFPAAAAIVAGLPMLAALVVAWVGFPAPPTHAVSPASLRFGVCLVLATAVGWGAVAAAGRPLAGGRTAAVQWAHESAFNNIRDWMAPWRAPWLDS